MLLLGACQQHTMSPDETPSTDGGDQEKLSLGHHDPINRSPLSEKGASLGHHWSPPRPASPALGAAPLLL